MDFAEKTLSKSLMHRLLNISTDKSESADVKTSLSSVLTEEILQVDKQLLAIQTKNDELSGCHLSNLYSVA